MLHVQMFRCVQLRRLHIGASWHSEAAGEVQGWPRLPSQWPFTKHSLTCPHAFVGRQSRHWQGCTTVNRSMPPSDLGHQAQLLHEGCSCGSLSNGILKMCEAALGCPMHCITYAEAAREINSAHGLLSTMAAVHFKPCVILGMSSIRHVIIMSGHPSCPRLEAIDFCRS